MTDIKKIIYILAVMVVLLPACVRKTQVFKSSVISSGKTSDADVLKGMTYNVHHCNPPGKANTAMIDIPAISKVICEQNPDWVALQEIDDHTIRSGKEINEAQEIAKNTEMYFYFGKAIDYAGGGYGVAILSKYPISQMQTYYLPKDADKKTEQRVIITAKMQLPNGKVIRLGCTHLDVQNAKNRVLQVNEINRIASLDSIPFLLGGDFNDTAGSETIHLLDTDFQRSCLECEATIPSEHPKETIDYIAFTKKYPVKIVSHTVINESYASDHRPVVAVFQLH